MKGTHRHRLRHTAREFLTHWTIAGAVIALTGAAPERWLADIFHRLHIPYEVCLNGWGTWTFG
jgi:hypothetical protein